MRSGMCCGWEARRIIFSLRGCGESERAPCTRREMLLPLVKMRADIFDVSSRQKYDYML